MHISRKWRKSAFPLNVTKLKIIQRKDWSVFLTNFVCGVDKIKNELRQDGTNEIFLAAGRSSALE